MVQSVEANVQLPGNPVTGPQVRTLQLVVLDSGTPVTVQMEVVSISDEAGNVINLADRELSLAMIEELRAIRRLLAAQMAASGIAADFAPEPRFSGLGQLPS